MQCVVKTVIGRLMFLPRDKLTVEASCETTGSIFTHKHLLSVIHNNTTGVQGWTTAAANL